MNYHEKRKWGRARVSQPLMLRSGKNPNLFYKAVSMDVSEENIGIETEAKLVLGEEIQLVLETPSRVVLVQAIVKRAGINQYGCNFAEGDYGKLYCYLTYISGKVGTALEAVKTQGRQLISICRKILPAQHTLPAD